MSRDNIEGNMKRIHVSLPQNLINMTDEIQKETGAPRAEIIRRALIHCYGEKYPQYLEEE